MRISIHGRGHHKSPSQRHYERFQEYTNKLNEYTKKLRICGDERNIHEIYGFYPKYPIEDAGYGSFNNYIYCLGQAVHSMQKRGCGQNGFTFCHSPFFVFLSSF